MTDNRERLRQVVQRAAVRHKKSVRRKTAALGSISGTLGCMLLWCIGALQRPDSSVLVPGDYEAVLLVDGAGGYVLTAVTSFATAAALCILLLRLRDRADRGKDICSGRAAEDEPTRPETPAKREFCGGRE